MNKLNYIKKIIYNMQNRENCLKKCINEKLNNSLDNYKNELQFLCDELLYNNSSKVLKNIIDIQKKENDENGNN